MKRTSIHPRSIDPAEWHGQVIAMHPRPKDHTHWFPGTVAPARSGPYQRCFTDGVYVHWFDAERGTWHHDRKASPPHWRQVGDYPAWRGLSKKPRT